MHGHAPHLYVLCESPEHLLGYNKGLEEVFPPGKVNGVLLRVVPVEVCDGLLQSQQVVHCAGDDVDCGSVASLRPEVVLEGWEQVEGGREEGMDQ